jgi:hypothetical protein
MTSYPMQAINPGGIPVGIPASMPVGLRGWTTVGRRAHRASRSTVTAEGQAAGQRTISPILAAERQAGYDLDPSIDAGATTSAGADDGGAPFGLPVLVEVPALAGVLEAIELAERQMLQAVVGVARLVAGDEVAQTTGVSVEHWLAIVCRQTRLDRRLLLRLARLLDRFPTLAAGVAAGRVSFAQLRGLGIVLRQAPKVIDAELEVLLGRLLAELQGADPDVLVDQVRQAIVELAPTATVEASDQPANRLVIQPNLAGTGGRFAGELDTLGLAILDQTTAPRRDQRNHPGGMAGARADNLLTHLTHHHTTTDGGGDTRTGDDGDTDSAPTDAGVADAADTPARRLTRPARPARPARLARTMRLTLRQLLAARRMVVGWWG